MKSEQMIKKLTYNGFGFPVVLHDVPAKMIRGNIEPVINYKTLGAEAIQELCRKKTPLTGNQMKFIRQYLDITLRDFAKIFGVTHHAAMKWEAKMDKFIEITPATEVTIRFQALFLIHKDDPKAFHKSVVEIQGIAGVLCSSRAKQEAPLRVAV
jgi:DNA-binding transcriptional regulator YiaG